MNTNEAFELIFRVCDQVKVNGPDHRAIDQALAALHKAITPVEKTSKDALEQKVAEQLVNLPEEVEPEDGGTDRSL